MPTKLKSLLIIVSAASVFLIVLSLPFGIQIGGKIISLVPNAFGLHEIVPEPSTFAVLGIAGLYFAIRKRKR